MSNYVAEFNSVTFATFFKYVAIGGGLSCLASVVTLSVKGIGRPFLKYVLASALILPCVIYLWWKIDIYIPRIGFSEHFMAWELGVHYGLLGLLAWWVASFVSVLVKGNEHRRGQAVAIAIGLFVGFFVGLFATGRYQTAMGRGPIFPVHYLIIFPFISGFIGYWCRRRKTPRTCGTGT